MNFQESKFTRGTYKRARGRQNRNWRGRGSNWRSPQQRYKEQHFNNQKKFLPNGIYKFGSDISSQSSSYGLLNQNVQGSVFSKKEHLIRPKSPFPGSEEYTQRNIEKASDFIKKQLQIDENISANSYTNSSHIRESLLTGHDDFPKYTDLKNENSCSAQSDKGAKCTDNDDYNVLYSSKHNFSTSSHQRTKHQQLYDVNEIHNKLIDHISSLSRAKKVNIINQVGPTGYDLAVQQIQKQKRIELSQALREMCKEKCFNEKTETISSIIPDFDIPIESLPKEIIEKLSTSLDIYFDDNNFSFPNLIQTNNNSMELSRDNSYVPDPIVPETYFRQAENLLKDSLEYLPECKQLKTDLSLEQNCNNKSQFLLEDTNLNTFLHNDELLEFKESYQPSLQGSDIDQSNFESDDVALPNPMNKNNDQDKNEYLIVPDFKQKQNTNTLTNLGDSLESDKLHQNELGNVNIETNDSIDHAELQAPDTKIKNNQVKSRPEKVHFEITSKQKLLNKKICDHSNIKQSTEVKSKLKKTKEEFLTQEIAEHMQKQKMESGVKEENSLKHQYSKNNDEINQKNKIQNNPGSSKDSNYFTQNHVVEKQKDTCSTVASMIEHSNDLELRNDRDKMFNNTRQQNTKVNLQKNKISLNRDSYKETMKIINESDYYKYSSKNPSVKNKEDADFPCLNKNFNPYTSYLKPTKIILKQGQKQPNQKEHKNAGKIPSKLNSKRIMEDLAIEEIVKGFSSKKERQESANVQMKFKDVDEHRNSTTILYEKTKSSNKRPERRKIKRTKQKNAMKYVNNDLEEELLQTAYREMEDDNKHVNIARNDIKVASSDNDSEYLNSFSVGFTNVDKVVESFINTNTETTANEKSLPANNTLIENIESNSSQSCKDKLKSVSNESTIQSIYEYENEDLDYDYDMLVDVNNSTASGADLNEDEMVRLWEKRAFKSKDVLNVVEENVLEDGKLWNNFVEKSHGDISDSDQGGGFVVLHNSKSDSNSTLNFDNVNKCISTNLKRNISEKESSSMTNIGQSLQNLKKSNNCETEDCILHLKNVNLSVNNENEKDTIKSNNDLIMTEKNLKLEMNTFQDEMCSKANHSNLNKETVAKCIDEQMTGLKNETTVVKINNSLAVENFEKNTNNSIFNKSTLKIKSVDECSCDNERSSHSKCTEKKDTPETDNTRIENVIIYSDKDTNAQQKESGSSTTESYKSSNKEFKSEINSTKENTSHEIHSTHKTSLNKMSSPRKGNDIPEKLAFVSRNASTLGKPESHNKSYHSSKNRKRKIRVRNNYSQTERCSMKDIELQTDNNLKECNALMVQCEIDNSNQNIENHLPNTNSLPIFDSCKTNENANLIRNDAISKLIEIDKQIENLLKMRQSFYKVLCNNYYEKIEVTSKSPNLIKEISTVGNENNLSIIKSSDFSDSSQLKINPTKRRKIKKDAKLHNIRAVKEAENISNTDVKRTASLVLQDSSMISTENQFIFPNEHEKYYVKDLEPNTTTKNICMNKHLKIKNNEEINTTAKEVPKIDEFSTANKSSLSSDVLKVKHKEIFSEKKKDVCKFFDVKKCNNLKNQEGCNEIQYLLKEEIDKPTKRRKRHVNFKTVIESSSSIIRNEQSTLKLSRKRSAQENDEGLNKENRIIQKCQNVPYTSEINLEKQTTQNVAEHNRKQKKMKLESANVETSVDEESKLKNNLNNEFLFEKGNTRTVQREEESIVDNIYKEMQKLKCIVRVERLSLEQVGASATSILQNTNTLQNLGEYSNLKIGNEFLHISQFSDHKEYEKVCDSKQTDLKQNAIELNSRLHLNKEENVTKGELSRGESIIESENEHNSQDEQYIESLKNKVDLNCNENLKMEQEIASNGVPENDILVSTNNTNGDLKEISFKHFEGVILVIKVVSGIIIAASDKGKLFCYSLSSGLLLHIIDVCSVAITSLCVLKNNKQEEALYTGSLDVKLNIYNFKTKEKIKSENVGEPIQCMEYAWDYLFIGSDRGSIIRYDVQKEKIDYKEKIFDLNVLVLRATQEGARKVLVVAARNNPVSVRDAMSGLLMRTMETPFCPTVYTLLLEKNFVFCGTSQHDILVYTFEDGQLIFKHEATKSKGVVCMQIVKNLLFAGCYNGNVYIYNIKTNKHLGTMTGPGGLLLSMEIVNEKIIVGTKSSKFKLWTIPNQYLVESENIT